MADNRPRFAGRVVMNWSAEIETDRSVLMRIVAILLALADLAERAAGASRPVRRQVLWALRQADEVARELVTGSACGGSGDRWPPAATPVRHGFDPADAADLAASLRMLAFMVLNMAAQASPGETHRERFVFSRAKRLPLAGSPRRGKVNCALRFPRAPPRPPKRRRRWAPWSAAISIRRPPCSPRDTSNNAHAPSPDR
jgi:hypothetical protein